MGRVGGTGSGSVGRLAQGQRQHHRVAFVGHGGLEIGQVGGGRHELVAQGLRRQDGVARAFRIRARAGDHADRAVYLRLAVDIEAVGGGGVARTSKVSPGPRYRSPVMEAVVGLPSALFSASVLRPVDRIWPMMLDPFASSRRLPSPVSLTATPLAPEPSPRGDGAVVDDVDVVLGDNAGARGAGVIWAGVVVVVGGIAARDLATVDQVRQTERGAGQARRIRAGHDDNAVATVAATGVGGHAHAALSTRDATFIDHAAIAQHGPVSAIAAWGDAGGAAPLL